MNATDSLYISFTVWYRRLQGLRMNATDCTSVVLCGIEGYMVRPCHFSHELATRPPCGAVLADGINNDLSLIAAFSQM